MAEEEFDVKVPDMAVAGETIDEPTVKLLRRLNLLPAKGALEESGGLKAAFGGPPESVALIEAGATAAAKWWAAGLGAAVLAVWSPFAAWWVDLEDETQRVTLWVAGIVTAAAVIGIAYLLASDVSGRAAATSETIRARAVVADAFVRAAESSHARKPAAAPDGDTDPELRFAALPADLRVNNPTVDADDEGGWRAVAVLTDGDKNTRYLVVKDKRSVWADAGSVKFQK